MRNAEPSDAAAMAEVDRHAWPVGMAPTADIFEARIEAFPEGQLVATVDDHVMGTCGAQRITEEFLAKCGHRYDLVTDHNRLTHSHHPDGEIFQLIGVGVIPAFRGDHVGRQLVDRQIAYARSLPSVRRILGFTRPSRYFRFRDLPIEDYLRRRNSHGRLFDPVLAFHLEAGARIVSVHRNFRPNDERALGHGVLIEYPRNPIVPQSDRMFGECSVE